MPGHKSTLERRLTAEVTTVMQKIEEACQPNTGKCSLIVKQRFVKEYNASMRRYQKLE